MSLPYTFLFVQAGGRRVLVDTGIGRPPVEVLGAVGLSPTGPDTFGRLPENLAAAGIQPTSIDTLIITHAHPDHVGGMLDAQGNLTFPEAHYYISEDEWNFWMSDQTAPEAPPEMVARMVAIARHGLEPIREHVTLVRGEVEILPGISMVPAGGHTPGQMAVIFRSGGEVLIYTADAALTPLHLEHSDWVAHVDALPVMVVTGKRQLFDRAVAEQALVMGSHLAPFPSLGHVVRAGDGWAWQPVGRP